MTEYDKKLELLKLQFYDLKQTILSDLDFMSELPNAFTRQFELYQSLNCWMHYHKAINDLSKLLDRTQDISDDLEQIIVIPSHDKGKMVYGYKSLLAEMRTMWHIEFARFHALRCFLFHRKSYKSLLP